MNSSIYPAKTTVDKIDGGYVVQFIDLPEAITQGENLEEAFTEAIDCLTEAVANRIALGLPLPPASRIGKKNLAVPLPAQMAAKAALYLALREANISNDELALRLHWDEKDVRRLLDPHHASKLPQIESALAAIGKRLVVGVQGDR